MSTMASYTNDISTTITPSSLVKELGDITEVTMSPLENSSDTGTERSICKIKRTGKPSQTMINTAQLLGEDMTGIFKDLSAYTSKFGDSGLICLSHTKVTGGKTQNIQTTDLINHIQMYMQQSLSNIWYDGKLYQDTVYVWNKIGSPLTFPKTDMYVDRVSVRMIDPSNYILFLLNTRLYNITGSSLRAYTYNALSDKYTQLTNINDDFFGGGKVASITDDANEITYYRNGIIYLYEIPSVNTTTIGISLTATYPLNLSSGEFLVPHYVTNNDYVAYTIGTPNKLDPTRFTLNRIIVASTESVNGQITIINGPILDLSKKKFVSIKRTSIGLVINKTGTRIAIVHLAPFFDAKLSQEVIRYYSTVYDLRDDSSLGTASTTTTTIPPTTVTVSTGVSVSTTVVPITFQWVEYKQMEGSYLDLTWLEAKENIPLDIVFQRQITTTNSGEYRNLSISPDSVGQYISLWCPFVQGDNELTVIKPVYEEISSIVRIDAIA